MASPVLPARHPQARALALLLSLCWSGQALAQANPDLTTIPLEQLLTMEVYSASRYVQQASAAPSSVTVISAAEIRQFGWRTLADVARSVRGLYVNYDRNYSYLGERGFLRPGDYNTRFLLQIDGNRINDPVYDQAPLGGEFPLDLALVERIEFVPGPGSSVYGSNAFFGVINVITKAAPAAPRSEVALDVGQWGERKLSASTSWRAQQGAAFTVSASRYSNRGQDLYYREFDTPAQHHGVAEGLDYERGTRLFGRVALGALSLSLIHAARTKGVPTASFHQPFNDPRERTTDQQSYVSAQYRATLNGGAQLEARLFWGSYDSFGDYVNPDFSLNQDGSNGRWWGAGVQLTSRRFAGHTLVGGLELQRDYRLHQYNFDVAPYRSYLDDSGQALRAGLFLQDEMALGEHLLLDLGLRADHSSGLATVASPRAALIGQLGAATTFKAIYGKAFRAPNSYEKYYSYPGAGGQLANPDLAKEEIVTTELALVRQFGQRARLTLTAYDNDIARLITQTYNPRTDMTRFDNARRLGARGIELEYERNWASSALLRANLSWNRVGQYAMGPPAPVAPAPMASPKMFVPGAPAPAQANAPARLAKLNAALPLAGGWMAGAEAQYVGPRRTSAGSTGGFCLLNANFYTARLAERVEASLGIANLLDRRYADPGAAEHTQAAIAQDRRHAHVRLAYVF